MLDAEQREEVRQALREAVGLVQAEKAMVAWLEERYGRGSVRLVEAATRGQRRPIACHLAPPLEATATARPAARNEQFELSSEARDLGEFDLALLEEVGGLFREELPGVYAREGRDPLTGLLDASAFPRHLSELTGSRSSLCLVLFDVDRFGEYTSAFGSSEANRMLVEIAEVLAQSTRPTDFVFRLQSDEFALLLPVTTLDVACRVAERVREALIGRFGGDNLPLTASFGVASWPDRTADAQAMVQAANTALLQARQEGGNRLCLGGDDPSTL